MNHHFKMFTH